jgi:hypothetical protein
MEQDAKIRQRANYKELRLQKRTVFHIGRNERRVGVRMVEERTGNSTRRRWTNGRRLRRQGGERNKNKGHAMREKKETRNNSYQWAQIWARF